MRENVQSYFDSVGHALQFKIFDRKLYEISTYHIFPRCERKILN